LVKKTLHPLYIVALHSTSPLVKILQTSKLSVGSSFPRHQQLGLILTDKHPKPGEPTLKLLRREIQTLIYSTEHLILFQCGTYASHNILSLLNSQEFFTSKQPQFIQIRT